MVVGGVAVVSGDESVDGDVGLVSSLKVVSASMYSLQEVGSCLNWNVFGVNGIQSIQPQVRHSTQTSVLHP